jgi:CBS domain
MFAIKSPRALFDHIAYIRSSTITHSNGARVRSPDEPTRIALTDPAVRVVTDFTWEQPVTIAGDCAIDDALRKMMFAGVRALLVVRGDVVLGLITSYDIQGERLSQFRLSQFLYASNYTRHDEIKVGHVMTPWRRVPTLDWQLVRRARVLELASFFKITLATHAVIVEDREQGGTFVRGLTSRARLERRLGHSINR